MFKRPASYLLISLFAVLLTTTGCGVSTQEEGQRDLYLAYGFEYYNSKAYARAADQFEKALAIDPTDSEARLMLGYAYLMLPRGDRIYESYHAFYKCTEDNPDDPRAQMGLGTTRFLLGVYYEQQYASNNAKASERLHRTKDTEISEEQRLIFARESRRLAADAEDCKELYLSFYEATTEPLEKAQELDPDNLLVIHMLAYNHIKLGPDQYPQALKWLALYIEIHEAELIIQEQNLEKAMHTDSLNSKEARSWKHANNVMTSEVRKSRSMSAYMHMILATNNPEMASVHLTAAEEQIDSATLLDPHHASPHINQAKICFAKSKLASDGNDEEREIEYLRQARNELFLFCQKNQLGSGGMNVVAKQVIQFLDKRIQDKNKPVSSKEN